MPYGDKFAPCDLRCAFDSQVCDASVDEQHEIDVVDTLKKRGLRDKIKVMIGGAPVTKRFADEIGADGYAMEAASATEIARKLAKA